MGKFVELSNNAIQVGFAIRGKRKQATIKFLSFS